MDELVFYSMISLIISRLIGLVTFSDYYNRTRRKNFLLLSLGWFLYCLAPLFFILSDDNSEDWLYSFYGYFAAIGSLLIIIAGIKNFRELSANIIVLSSIIISVIPLVIFLVTSSPAAVSFSGVVLQFLVLMIAFALTATKYSFFKEKAGNSVYWFLFVVALSFVHAFSYIFIYTDDTVVYSYLLTNGISLLAIIFFIHLEHNVTIKTSRILKDKYSHELENIIQIILSQIELTTSSDDYKSESLKILEEKCLEAADHITNIRKL